MINDLDETLRRLLEQELPIPNGEVDIEFDLPNREWTAKLSKPTLNVYLYDMRENTTLRDTDWIVERNEAGRATRRKPPKRVDLSYLITAWAAEVEDEHRLLTRVLRALFQFKALPAERLQGDLAGQTLPIYTRVADPDSMPDAFELWTVLDNELKPAVNLVVTLPIDPAITITGPIVRTRIIRTFSVSQPETTLETMTRIGGRVLRQGTQDGLAGAAVSIKDTGFSAVTDEDGRYAFSGVPEGEHRLIVQVDGTKKERDIVIPGTDYDVEIGDRINH